jgi:hypothetical protein
MATEQQANALQQSMSEEEQKKKEQQKKVDKDYEMARDALIPKPTQVSGQSAETATNIVTLGQAPEFSEKVGRGVAAVDQKAQEFLARLDPTNTKIPKASTSGVQSAQQDLRTVGQAATEVGDVGRQLLSNTSQFNMQAPTVGPAATATAGTAPTTTDVRGTTQQVTAQQVSAGTMTPAQIAQLQAMSPAQIAELERMQAAGISREDLEFRQKQMALANSLEAAARGEGPSIAASQLQKANEDAIKAQQALAASARGGNPVLAQRQAAMNIAALQQENAAKSAELKLQEAQQARAQLGDVLGSARGQDIGVSTSQAGFEQEATKVNKMAEDQRVLQQSQLDQEAAKVNKLAEDQRALTQAGFEQEALKASFMADEEAKKFNADLALKAATFNSDQDFKAAMSDAERQLDAQKTAFLANIDVSKFNAQAQNEMERFKADSLLRTQIANQAAQLQATGMGIEAIARQLGIQQQTAEALITSETAMFTAEQQRLGEQKKADSAMAGNLLSTAGTVAAAIISDETDKKNIKPLDLGSDTKKKDFSTRLQESMAAVKSKEPKEQTASGGFADMSKMISGALMESGKEGAASSGAAEAAKVASDKNTKKNVKSDNPKIDALLGSLKGYEFEYKDSSKPGTADGKRYGVMAQDLEKTDAGKSVVIKDPKTGKKQIDVGQATGLLFASLGRLNDKVDQLSKKRK